MATISGSGKTDARLRLTKILHQGAELLMQLKTYLEEERNHLENNNYDALQLCSQNKQTCLELITQHETDLNDLLQEQQLSLGKTEIKQLIHSYDPDNKTQLSAIAQRYETLLIQCNDLNSINGRIIQKSQLNAATLLNLIKGAVKQNETYTRQGKTRSNQENKPIAKA